MLRQLVVRNFRNLDDQSWDLATGSHLLLGGTGAGKTSLLEAAYFAATTRSFRTGQLGDMLRSSSRGGDDEASVVVRAEVETARRVALEVGWSESRGAWRSVNDSETALAEHLEVLPVLAWTARDGETLTGSPELRRRLVDRGVIGRTPGALATFVRYRRVLQQKRELLWRRQAGLESWNELLAPAAAEIVHLRREYIDDLRGALSSAAAKSGLAYPEIELRYEPSPPRAGDGVSAVASDLAAAAASEREQRRPLVGPHRDRLVILWGGRELRRIVSAGERKALGLLLLAAQGGVLERAGRRPMYLVDDADIELDRPTLGALWTVLRGGGDGRQSLVTSNRPEVWEGLETGHQWAVRGGRLTASP